jgi:hypothetical protein
MTQKQSKQQLFPTWDSDFDKNSIGTPLRYNEPPKQYYNIAGN